MNAVDGFEHCATNQEALSEYAGVVQRRILVYHESRVGLLATAIEMEADPPVAASENNKIVCRLNDGSRMS